ncbi:uncharacterized protein LOC144713908 [Wolffia australiana]
MGGRKKTTVEKAEERGGGLAMAEGSLGGAAGSLEKKIDAGGAPIRRLQWRRRRTAAETRRKTAVLAISRSDHADLARLIARGEEFDLGDPSESRNSSFEGERSGFSGCSVAPPEEGNEAENADLDRNPRFDKRRRIPSAEEMEEFFAEAEKQEQLRFLNKYNFDVVRDAPMAGRFLWISAAP